MTDFWPILIALFGLGAMLVLHLWARFSGTKDRDESRSGDGDDTRT